MINSAELLQQKLDFWGQIKPREQEYLINSSRKTYYKKGTHIYNTKQDCVGLILVAEGCLRLYIMSDEGREVTLFRVYSGEVCILSASCILNNITFDVYIDAQKDTEAIVIPSGALKRLMDNNIYAECFVYKQTVDKFSDVMWAMEQILFMSFDKRLAIFLLEESIKENEDTLYLTHEEIAKYLGSAREVVSRMMKYFENEGVLRLFRGGAEIIDKEKLRRYA